MELCLGHNKWRKLCFLMFVYLRKMVYISIITIDGYAFLLKSRTTFVPQNT